MADGEIVGLLSGGCLEEDLKSHAQQVFALSLIHICWFDWHGALPLRPYWKARLDAHA